MKPSRSFIAFMSALVLGLLVAYHFWGSTAPLPPQPAAFESEAREGTAENPWARLEHEWLQLHDPATNQIPTGIAQKELDFVQRLAQQSNLRSLTAADDWVARGPHNIGGRTHALGIDVTDENVILAGGASGGMFKSTDGGQTWRKTTAPNQLHSVTALAQNTAPGNEHIWYYSTGFTVSQIGPENNGWIRGDGIYKSVDGGDSWTLLPATISNTPAQDDPFDYIWSLATFGEEGVFAGTASGLYRSTDGGLSWTPVLNFEMTGDHRVNDHRTEILVAGDGSFYATVAGDRATNGIYHSVDGETWTNISPAGWPASTIRTVIATASEMSNAVYFLTLVARQQQVLNKYEPGVGWTDLTDGLPLNAQMETYGGTMLLLGVKPDDENVLFVGTIGMYRSTDGGETFEEIGGRRSDLFYVDQTALAFYPSSPDHMIIGNDGGLYRTSDNVATTIEESLNWESLNSGYLTTQFYTVAIDHGTPGSETLLGGTQDHGIVHTDASDPAAPWQGLVGGDGGYTAIANGGTYLYSAQAAHMGIHRYTRVNDVLQRTEITPTSVPLGLWLTTFQLDPHDQKVMYLPSQQTLWRNTDLTAIPEDPMATSTDINWEPMDHITGYYFYALGMSEAAPRRLYYAATDVSSAADTKVFYLDNPHTGEPTPVDITGENFPFYPYTPFIRCINVDPRDVNKLLVVFPNYGVHSIYATDDGGQTWTPVSGNLEENPDGTGNGPSVRWVSTLYVDDQPVYLAGTSAGLFSSIELDGMNTIWSPEGRETIGHVAIDMIDVRQSDGYVAVATYGNGTYTTYITEVPDVAISVDEPTPQPETFALSAPYPNPVNTTTTLPYALPRAGMVTASVYNLRGQKIETLFQARQQAGRHELRWDTRHVASGVYFIRLDFENVSQMRQVVVQK